MAPQDVVRLRACRQNIHTHIKINTFYIGWAAVQVQDPGFVVKQDLPVIPVTWETKRSSVACFQINVLFLLLLLKLKLYGTRLQ